MAPIMGIGGVFIKARGDAKALAEWYRGRLGLELEDFGGAILNWQQHRAEDGGLNVRATADPDGTWFAASASSLMINYRVDDMDGLIAQLTRAGIPIQQGPEVHKNRRFAWIMDPEDNKVELCEPKLWGDTTWADRP
ncbi:VOC family protein [Leisingera methylohalidivorans]|uniref:Glyoxalase n=1 Tax=Leisingera methylohalidivorans DSM 14336 TaxID=999552 RepID=V9VXZ7_9RHOB|nr:VOC family protein [Leisingera methylohalidivorans]AHD02798.1 glyoxalase [Leisingera methylohalidivorans DSM 14336]